MSPECKRCIKDRLCDFYRAAESAGAVSEGMILSDGSVADGAGSGMRAVAVVGIGVGVTGGVNNLLRNDSRAADRAVGACRQASCGAVLAPGENRHIEPGRNRQS